MANLTLEIFTPAGLALQDSASQVTLPADNGEIGILPDHIRYTGLLGTGLLEYYSTEEKKPKRLVLSGGFTNVSENKVTILADSIDLIDGVDRNNYAEKRSEYTELVANGVYDEPECVHARTQLARIEAIDKLISH